MTVFRRRFGSLLKSLLIAVVTGGVVGYGCYLFLPSPALVAGIPSVVFLALLYLSLFSENIRIEVDDSGLLRYYQKGRLRREFHLPDCAARCRIVTESGFPQTHDITLYLADSEEEGECDIDCSPLGYNQFARLYQLIEAHCPDHVAKLPTTKRA